MATFDFEVSLVSVQISFGRLDSSYGSDAYEAFDYDFRNKGGTEILYDLSPCLRDGMSSPSEDTTLVGLFWDSDKEQFDGAEPNYEIQSVSGDQDEGWDYDFHYLLVFHARATAASLEEAIEKVRNEALNYLEMYDGVCDEVLEVDDVRIVSSTEKI